MDKAKTQDMRVERATPEKLKTLNIETWSPWQCGCETFDWQYDEDERAYVKEGRVTVRAESGQEIAFGSGDLVFFPAGLKCTWTISEPIRKVYRLG